MQSVLCHLGFLVCRVPHLNAVESSNQVEDQSGSLVLDGLGCHVRNANSPPLHLSD